jgi:hypothetical protein
MSKSLAPVNFGDSILTDQCAALTIQNISMEAVENTRQTLLRHGITVNGQTVSLTSSPGQFGGQRLWLSCPACQRRCGKLYQHPQSHNIACRVCLGIKYRKSRYKGMIEADR